MNNYFGFQGSVPMNYGTQTPTQGIFTGQPSQMQMNPMMGMAAMNLLNQARPGQQPSFGQSLMGAAVPLAMMANKQGGFGGLMGMANQMPQAPQAPTPSMPGSIPGAFGFGAVPQSGMADMGGLNPSMFMGA